MTLALVGRAGGHVEAQAWGPGAEWALESLPSILGVDDDVSGFDVESLSTAGMHLRLRATAARSFTTWRVPRTSDLLGALVATVLGQRVTGIEAHASWQRLVRWHGAAAPSAPDSPMLMVAPSAREWREIPSWQWHRAGVDPRRAATVRAAVCAVESVSDLDAAAVRRRLLTVSGVGVWTDAMVASQVFGDADAVPYKDAHISNDVGFALTGATRTTDNELEQVLQPWLGHRFRVVRLVQLAGISAPRFGPRYAPMDFRSR